MILFFNQEARLASPCHHIPFTGLHFKLQTMIRDGSLFGFRGWQAVTHGFRKAIETAAHDLSIRYPDWYDPFR